MTITSLQQSDYYNIDTVPENIKREMVKEENTSSLNFSGLQKELSQILANVQPPQAVQETAKRQHSNGRLDVKV